MTPHTRTKRRRWRRRRPAHDGIGGLGLLALTAQIATVLWACYCQAFTVSRPLFGGLRWQPVPLGTVLFMGKGDKSKRPKKLKKPAASSAAALPSPPQVQARPLRVTNDINIPIRHQIEMARLNKKLQSTGGSFRKEKKVRTAYRKALSEQEEEEKALERKRRGQNPDWDVILSRNRTSPLVIVDGYNIIYKWPRLKKHMIRGDPAQARQLLIEHLENLRTVRGWRIEVVFDGTRRNTAGPLGHNYRGAFKTPNMEKAATASISKHGVRVVYSGVGTEADSYIEARALKAQNATHGEMTSSFIIATDDSMIRLAGDNAGALCMCADHFIDELKAAQKSVSYLVEVAVATANGHTVRPESLRGTAIHRFGRGSVLIADKRNRTRSRTPAPDPDPDIDIDIKVEEINGLHWAFVAPNRTTRFS